MARPKTENLTPLELEIMHVLWETGPANVQTVQQKLKRELAYTTVQTMLNILERKGKAKRTLKEPRLLLQARRQPQTGRRQTRQGCCRSALWRIGGESGDESRGNQTSDARKTRAPAETGGTGEGGSR